MTKHVLAIHGAFSTPLIWTFLKKSTPNYKWHFVDYSDQTKNITGIIADVENKFEKSNIQFHLVGHSMGGLIALSLENRPWAKSVTTIATPLGGLDLTILQLYLSKSGFLGEITSYGNFIETVHKSIYTKPVQHIITTNGFNPWMFEPNDGVVSLKSQRGWCCTNAETHDIHANHSEVMLHDGTVDLIQKFWK